MLAASILLALLPTASAFSSAQYPAVSCSSCPAIPSNDRGWNSVRTSSGRCSRYSSIARCSALSATVVIAGRIMFSDARQLAHTKKSLVFILQGTSTLAHAGKQTIGCYVELQHCNTILASQSLEWARQPRVVWQLLIQLSYYCSLP